MGLTNDKKEQLIEVYRYEINNHPYIYIGKIQPAKLAKPCKPCCVNAPKLAQAYLQMWIFHVSQLNFLRFFNANA